MHLGDGRMKYISILLILFFNGCAARQVSINQMALKYKKAKSLYAQGNHEEANPIFKQLCEEEKRYAESCEYLEKTEFSNNSVVEYFYNEINYVKIQNIVCKNIIDKNKCNIEMSNVFYAKLNEAYPFANYSQIDLHCKANPEKCFGNPAYVEKVIKESHIKSVADNKRYAEQVRSQENSLMWAQILYGISSQLKNQNDSADRTREIQELKKRTTTCTTRNNETICKSH